MSTVESERLAQVFVELADTLIDDFDLVEFLQVVTARVTELSGVGTAGLLLADARGRLQFMAASDERVHLLELFQLQADEGPCLDGYRGGAPVSEADLARAGNRRWPVFAPRAVSEGFRAVNAFPLRLRHQVIGALGLFRTDAGALAEPDVHIFQALADVATIGVLQEQAIRRQELLAGQLQGALNSRVVIEQAKGVIAQLYTVDVDTAFEFLRGYSRRTRQHLSSVAAAIVADPGRAPDLTPPS